MRTFIRHCVVIVMLTFASMAAVTIVTPAVSKADCGDGEWWDPTGKVCRPLGVGPQPLACDPGQWWDRRPTCAGPSVSGRNRWRVTTAGGGIQAPTNAVRPRYRRAADTNTSPRLAGIARRQA
jgi:hypothetical protein